MNVTYNQSRNVFYTQVFHPNVSDQAKATVIEVGEGGEANNVDITVGHTLQTYSASGQLVDENGLPMPNLRFGLQRQLGQRAEYSNNSAAANSRGEFIVEGLVPGKYTVFLFSNQTEGRRVEPLSFDVVDHDVTGLTVRLSTGVSISGFVVLENGDKAALAQLLQMQLRAFSVISMEGGATFPSSAMSPIGPDGSFRLSGLSAGTVSPALVALGIPLPPKGFLITRIERDGVASPRGLEVKDGEQLVGVRVFVSYGTATLRGVVTVENGSLPDKARVFVRLTKPGDTVSNMRPAMVDQRGHFLMEGLPAGTYELHAVLNLPGLARTIKRAVTLQDGQTTEVTINVDSSKPQEP